MIDGLRLTTPFYRLNTLSGLWGIDLWIKRDDLIPEFLGGNKVRKNSYIFQKFAARAGRPDILITNGSVESNHARVVALMGAQLGCSVHLVLHGERPSATALSGNAFFYSAAGAKVSYVDSGEIADTIADINERFSRQGRVVLVIPGGGHCEEAVAAYADAFDELPFSPDWIVHASGTGGTQAGLLTGIGRRRAETRVIGVSVARDQDRGTTAVADLIAVHPAQRIIFNDAFRFGGYGQHAPDLISFIRQIVRLEGMPLDPTYTGKAMFGLAQLIKSGEISKGSRVVFWHTGGLLNLQAAQL